MCPQFEFSFKVHIILINSEYSDHLCNVSFEFHIKKGVTEFLHYIHRYSILSKLSVTMYIYVWLNAVFAASLLSIQH